MRRQKNIENQVNCHGIKVVVEIKEEKWKSSGDRLRPVENYKGRI